MSEIVIDPEPKTIDPAVEAAPEAPETPEGATPENDTAGDATVGDQTPKTFTQEELEAEIGKRLARQQRKLEREHRQEMENLTRKPSQPPQTGERIDPSQFATTEEYLDALAEQKAARIVEERTAKSEFDEVVAAHLDREEDARDRYPDYDQVAHNQRVRITDAMAEAIRASDAGPDIAYYLGSNPKEADRISRLGKFSQAREIGKIEAKLAAEPPQKKTTAAPAPIKPVTGKASTTPTYDTTDPRSVKTMSPEEWIKADRARRAKAAKEKLY